MTYTQIEIKKYGKQLEAATTIQEKTAACINLTHWLNADMNLIIGRTLNDNQFTELQDELNSANQ